MGAVVIVEVLNLLLLKSLGSRTASLTSSLFYSHKIIDGMTKNTLLLINLRELLLLIIYLGDSLLAGHVEARTSTRAWTESLRRRSVFILIENLSKDNKYKAASSACRIHNSR